MQIKAFLDFRASKDNEGILNLVHKPQEKVHVRMCYYKLLIKVTRLSPDI